MDANPQIYHRAFPALPGLVSGIDVYSAPAVNQGAVLDELNVINAKKEFGFREVLLTCGEATPEEVRDAKRRKNNLENTHNNEGVAPDWALQMMAESAATRAAIVQLQESVQQESVATRAEIVSLRTDIQHVRHSMTYNIARSSNRSSVRDPHHAIRPVPNDNTGAYTQGWYPATLEALDTASGPQMNPLLEFYQIVVPNHASLAVKAQLLKIYLGIMEERIIV
jgi:hypothetical protein